MNRFNIQHRLLLVILIITQLPLLAQEEMAIPSREISCEFLEENQDRERLRVVLYFLYADLRLQEDYLFNKADFDRFKSHIQEKCATNSAENLAEIADAYIQSKETINLREMTCQDIKSRRLNMDILITYLVVKSTESTSIKRDDFHRVLEKINEVDLNKVCSKNPQLKVYPLLTGHQKDRPQTRRKAHSPEMALEMTQEALKKKRPRKAAALWKDKGKAKGFLKQIKRKKLGLKLADLRKNQNRAILDVHIIKNGQPVDMVYMYLEEEDGSWLFIDINEDDQKAADFIDK